MSKELNISGWSAVLLVFLIGFVAGVAANVLVSYDAPEPVECPAQEPVINCSKSHTVVIERCAQDELAANCLELIQNAKTLEGALE